jgi:alpha-glucosidase
VRDLIKFRARLQPYLYDLMWRYAEMFEPIVRPTFYEFPHDARCFDDNDELMLGPSLLVASVVEPGATERRVYLPSGTDWYDYWRNTLHAGGEVVSAPAPWGRPPLFVRAGSVIAANLAEQRFAKPADLRGFYLFPLRGDGAFGGEIFDDDGETFAYKNGGFATWTVKGEAAGSMLRLSVTRTKPLGSGPMSVPLILPASERRAVTLSGARLVDDSISAAGRVVIAAL